MLVTMAAVAPDAAQIAALELREEEFEYVVTQIVRLTQNQFEHLVTEGITVIEDLILLDEDSLIGVFPATGNLSITAMSKMRLKTLRAWTINQLILLTDPQDNIDALGFTAEVCEKLQCKFALSDKSVKDSTATKTSSGITPGTFNGRVLRGRHLRGNY
jgi:hypothetical protein